MTLAVTPTFWEQVVGIPLDLWHAAETSAEIEALIQRRDAGEFKPREPETLAEHLAAHPDHDTFPIFTYEMCEPVRVICDCGRSFVP